MSEYYRQSVYDVKRACEIGAIGYKYSSSESSALRSLSPCTIAERTARRANLPARILDKLSPGADGGRGPVTAGRIIAGASGQAPAANPNDENWREIGHRGNPNDETVVRKSAKNLAPGNEDMYSGGRFSGPHEPI